MMHAFKFQVDAYHLNPERPAVMLEASLTSQRLMAGCSVTRGENA